MKRSLKIFIAAILLINSTLSAQIWNEDIRTQYNQIWNLKADQSAGFTVSDFEFDIDAAHFEFDQAEAVFFEPVNDQRFAVYLKGDGLFKLTPPTPVEKFSIKKFTDEASIYYEINDLLLFLSPDLYEEYFSEFELAESNLTDDANNKFDYYRDRLDEFSVDLPANILTRLHTSKLRPYVLALLEKGRDRFYFFYDPTETESVQLYQQKRYAGVNLLQDITMFYPQEHYQQGGSMYDRRPLELADPVHYKIQSRIYNLTDIECHSRLIIEANIDSLIAVPFYHHSRLEIDSVLDSEGDSLLFSKFDEDEVSTTWAFFNRPLMYGERDTIDFYYHSDDIIKKSPSGDFYLLAPSSWYPRTGYRTKSTFELSYDIPEHLQILSVGDVRVDSTTDDRRYAEYIVEYPCAMVGFNYGFFDSLVVTEPGLPSAHIYRSNVGHTGRLFASDMLEVTGKDILASIEFFSNLFGHYPFNDIKATDIPGRHGQSFPGFLHLAWASFEADYNAKGFEMDAFRAHEVSHQWWGTIIGYKSYHDQWLSEGFAEYSGLWYLQAKDGNNKRFLDLLDDLKDFVTQKGGGIGLQWSEGSDAGPIWLGYRLSSTKSSDYETLVYSKGAYVLHMLRMIMHDYTTQSDDRFIKMMQDYVRRYREKSASTIDFKNVVEQHMQMDMDWFFDEWIFSTEIPTFRPEYEVVEENGKYIIKANIQVEDVPDGWKMVVPLVVEFENDSHTVLKFWVTAPSEEYQSAPLPYKPKHFILNPYNAVLCHVK